MSCETRIENGVLLSMPHESRVEIPEGVHTISPYTFCNSNILEEAVLPSSMRAIGTGAFRGCKKLARINLPDGIRSISAMAFYDCEALKEIHLPLGLETFAPQIFARTGIAEFIVPPNLKNLGNISWTFDAAPRVRIVWPYDNVKPLLTATDVVVDGHKWKSKLWELEADNAPFGRVPVQLKPAVCRSVARRWLEGQTFSKKYLNNCRLWMRRNDVREGSAVPFLIQQDALPVEEVEGLLEQALARDDRPLAAALLEYRNRHPSGAESDLDRLYREAFES